MRAPSWYPYRLTDWIGNWLEYRAAEWLCALARHLKRCPDCGRSRYYGEACK